MEINVDKRSAALAYRILLSVYKDENQNYLKNQEDFDCIVGLINELMILRREKAEKPQPQKRRKRLLIVDILAELMAIRKTYQEVIAETNELQLKVEKIESTHAVKLNEKTEKRIIDKYTEFQKWNSRLELM